MVRQKLAKAIQAFNDNQNAITQLSKYPLFILAALASSLAMYCQKFMHWLKQLKSRSTTKILTSNLTFNLANRANHSLPHIVLTTIINIYDLEKKLAIATFKTSTITIPNPKSIVLVFGD